MEPLTQKFIRKLQEILITSTVDTYRQHVCPGEYRTVTPRPRDRELLPVIQINSSLTALIRDYEHQTEIERNCDPIVHVRHCTKERDCRSEVEYHVLSCFLQCSPI